ncbi:hypothetical protein ILUMI_19029 [Ignelater luminosus]|uniref:Cytochrome P450 n=1 Tax=Ignelater luminosus TaxID=2038154 RepID=A0A8K0G5U5_IGNLU|nr:hypothetical protein ILUMI_19029 [Ignelater luminosus]
MDMTYMDKCINETLRKYPPVSVFTRNCTQSYKIPNTDVIIDKHVQVLIPILEIQHDPEYYPEPDKFDPERFSPEDKAKRNHYTWLPFGEGLRSCIGMRFGLMQTKVALAVLIKHYRFSLNSKTQHLLILDPQSFILAPLGGVWLNTEKISDYNAAKEKVESQTSAKEPVAETHANDAMSAKGLGKPLSKNVQVEK